LHTHYADSGSNVDPEYEARNVLADLEETTKRSKEDCIEMMQMLKFTDIMMEGTIGALSGGWQMKLRLIRAVLLRPDILLLDEPTNHLDTKTVEWFTNYLQNLHETTVITVSHDTPFMENICTDIIHYEQRPNWGPYRKLVHYKGKMSVRVCLCVCVSQMLTVQCDVDS
jgi:elongation factor 3